MLGSIFLCYYSTLKADEEDSWPYGGWYLLANAYELLILQPLVLAPLHALNIMINFKYNPKSKNYGYIGKLLHYYATKIRFFIGLDISELLELS